MPDLYAIVQTFPDGEELVVVMTTAYRGGPVTTPMATPEPEKVEPLVEMAKQYAKSGAKLKLVKYTTYAEVLQEIT